jgi:hypothetical protein
MFPSCGAWDTLYPGTVSVFVLPLVQIAKRVAGRLESVQFNPLTGEVPVPGLRLRMYLIDSTVPGIGALTASSSSVTRPSMRHTRMGANPRIGNIIGHKILNWQPPRRHGSLWAS